MFITMKNVSDSRLLYRELVTLGNINVTDLDGVVYVYGDVDFESALAICKKWGDVIEQTQEENT